MEPLVVNNIDIGAVREQLLLLGHDVEDDAIVAFVRGLNLDNGEQQDADLAAQRETTYSSPVSKQHPTGGPYGFLTGPEYGQTAPTHTAGSMDAKLGPAGGTRLPAVDALPSKGTPQHDQASQAPLGLGRPLGPMQHALQGAEDVSPPPKSLDQRCRAFLSKIEAQNSPAVTPVRPRAVGMARPALPEPAAARPCARVQGMLQDGGAAAELPRARAPAAAGFSSSSEYSDDELSDSDMEEEEAERKTRAEGLFAAKSSASSYPSSLAGQVHGGSLAASHAQQHEHQRQLGQSQRPGSSDSSSATSSSSGSGGSRLRAKRAQAAAGVSAAAPMAQSATSATAAAPQATKDEPVIIRDLSRSQLPSCAGGSGFSGAQPRPNQHPSSSSEAADYLSKLSSAIHAAAAAAGAEPADLPGLQPPAAAGLGSQLCQRAGSGGVEQELLEPEAAEDIARWVQRPYGLPAGYNPVGLHRPPEPAPGSLTALALQQRQQRKLREEEEEGEAELFLQRLRQGLEQEQGQQHSSAAAAEAVDPALGTGTNGSSGGGSGSAGGQQQGPSGRSSSSSMGLGPRPAAAGRPLGLRIPNEASHSSFGLASPLGLPVLGGLGLDGGHHQQESIIASSSVERGIGSHSTARRLPSPKGPTDPLYKAPSSPGSAGKQQQLPGQALTSPPAGRLVPMGKLPVSGGLQAKFAAAAAAGPTGLSQARQGRSATAGSSAAGSMGRARASAPGAAGSPAAAAGAGAAPSKAGLGPCRSSSAVGGISGSSSSSRYSSQLQDSSCRSMYSVGFSSRAKGMAPGVKKVDRVARYQELQQQWDRDRFLRSGAGGAQSTAGRASLNNAPGTGPVR